MPTYAIQAPNGQTYQIDGPDGASDDQVRAEVLRQHPDADTVQPVEVTPPKKPATFLSTLGRAAWNLPADTLDTLKGVGHAVLHPVETAKAGAGMAENAAHILAGAIQHGREAYPEDQRGSAPVMDKSAYDKFSADNQAKYGSKQAIYKTVGDHPLGPAIAAASVVAPELAGVGTTVGDAAGAVAGKVGAKVGQAADAVGVPLKTITQAGRRGEAAAEAMRAEATTGLNAQKAQAATKYGAEQARAAAEADLATQQAQRASALADTSRAQGRTLNARSSEAAAAATPPVLNAGTPANLSELGDIVRTPALAKEGEINDAMRAADAKLRAAMEQVAAEREAKGVGISDMPGAKVLVKRSKDLVEPDPVARATVGNTPADSAGGKLHKMLIDALGPREEPLTIEQAKKLTKSGVKVNVAKDGTFSRTIKPSLENAEDFRRFLGKVRSGNMQGYEAIDRTEAAKMYGNVSKVIDKYADGTSAKVQANWRAGKQALEPFEKVRAGQALVGTQKGVDAYAVPAANIPGRIVAGGRDTIQQAAAVAGQEPVNNLLRSHVQNTLSTAKTADAASAMVRPGGKLGEVVANGPDDLQAAVSDYINRMKAAEQSGVQATDLSRRAGRSTDRANSLEGRADKFNKVAEALQGTSQKAAQSAADIARRNEADIATLKLAAPKDVGAQYEKLLRRAHGESAISTRQLEDGLKHAAQAEKEFGIKARRDAWLKRAAIGLGLPSLGAAGYGVLHGGH